MTNAWQSPSHRTLGTSNLVWGSFLTLVALWGLWKTAAKVWADPHQLVIYWPISVFVVVLLIYGCRAFNEMRSIKGGAGKAPIDPSHQQTPSSFAVYVLFTIATAVLTLAVIPWLESVYHFH